MNKIITAKWLLFVSSILILIGLAGCQNSEDGVSQVSAETLAQGQQVYTARCASCHGPTGEGQKPEAPLEPDETGRFPAPPHDGTGHTWHHDDDLLFRIVVEGGMGGDMFYEMPAFGESLSDDEIWAVLAHIKTMWTDEQRSIQHERTEAVRQQ